MKSFLVLAVLLLAASASADTCADRVMALVESGELQGGDAAWHLACSIVAPERLPASLTDGTEPARCGTPYVTEAIRLAESDPSSELSREALDLLARPTLSGPEYIVDSPAGWFKVHWTDQGEDASNSAYATALAAHADYCRQIECAQMGYDVPPSDLGLGGDNKYDLYVMQIDALGYTTYSGEPSDPTTPENDYASHIAILISMGDNLLKVTQSHEYQHAIQMGYDVSEPSWFMENTSTWIEDMVYDDVNDYCGYLHSGDNPLRKPWWDIRSGSGNLYWYGGCIWTRYIGLRMEVDAVRDIWEECGNVVGNNMLAAQGEIFGNYGLTWEQAFQEYGCWRWFTASQWYSGCGMFDDEATMWSPGPYVFPYHSVTTLPWTGNQGGPDYETDQYGLHWIRVNLANYQGGWVNMHFDGRDGFEWNLGVIMWDTAGNHEYYWYNCDASTGIKDVAVKAAGWDYVIFFPSFMSSTSVSRYYTANVTYSTGLEGGEQPGGLTLEIAGNPASAATAVTFGTPSSRAVRLDVYDLGGRIVRTLFDGETGEGLQTVQLGEGLVPGAYFVRLSAGVGVITRSIVVSD
jgi:hypothetical protein